MDYKGFYREIRLEKYLEKLAKKYKEKKIIIYGAGLMSKAMLENYDLSRLNIVGFCDAKYSQNSEEVFYGYRTFSPIDLKNIDFDIILVNLYKSGKVINKIKYELIINSKNEDKKVQNLIKINLWFILKHLFF